MNSSNENRVERVCRPTGVAAAVATAWTIALCAPVPSLAQAWDFGRLAESGPSPRAEVTVKGFQPKVRELNDAIVGDDSSRTRARAEQRSSGGEAPPTQASSGAYTKYKDKGRAPDWAWYTQEIVIKCVGGRENGNMPSIYLRKSGKWNSNRDYATFEQAATAACGG